MHIIGEAAEVRSAMCGAGASYMVKKIESSNQLIVLRDNAIIGDRSYYYELTRFTPVIPENIFSSLLATQYRGPAFERDSPPPQSSLIDRVELRTKVLASEIEFAALLQDRGVIELKGAMRLVSPEAVLEVLGDVLDVVIELDLDCDAVDESRLLAVLVDTDILLLRHSLRTVGVPRGGSWTLSADKVSAQSARLLLRDKRGAGLEGGKWNLADFMSMWVARTPGSTAPSIASLQAPEPDPCTVAVVTHACRL